MILNIYVVKKDVHLVVCKSVFYKLICVHKNEILLGKICLKNNVQFRCITPNGILCSTTFHYNRFKDCFEQIT